MYNNDIPGWMTPNDLRIIHALSKYVPKDGTILEIGCFLGRSTKALYDGKDTSVSLEVIDPFNDIYTWSSFNINPNFKDSGCIGSENLYDIAIYMARTKNWLEAFKTCIGANISNTIEIYSGFSENHIKLKDYDLVFIDGAHSYEGVKHDIEKYMTDSNLIVGDDFHATHPGVSRAINELRDYRTLVTFGESKIWMLVPRKGYWHDVIKNNNLTFL